MSSFDSIAEEYDQWFDSLEGRAIFEAELTCLRSVCPDFRDRWIEIGVGTGRFASALGIQEGIDPSTSMLEIAKRRAVHVTLGTAEQNPSFENTFDGILMALTLCFVDDAEKALSECRRVLRPSGKLLLGVIPADSPWGREYMRKAREGHPIYSLAHFRMVDEILKMVKSSGFELTRAASALFWHPDQKPTAAPDATAGITLEAGFLGLLFVKASTRSVSGAGRENR